MNQAGTIGRSLTVEIKGGTATKRGRIYIDKAERYCHFERGVKWENLPDRTLLGISDRLDVDAGLALVLYTI